jgi:LDH2 family malate/lactate/ureidoglycolate dehydrogenase
MGLLELLQYLDEYQQGYLLPNVVPKVTKDSLTKINIDGQGGLGIPALRCSN